MKTYKFLSWNVNGLRAIYQKGFSSFFEKENPDFFCLQETKASSDQIPQELLNSDSYFFFHTPSLTKKGYSGVALFSKEKPQKIEAGIGIPEYDKEGRFLIAYYSDFILFNIYFPNGKRSEERLHYKMEFYEAFLKYLKRLQKENHKIIICGDVNTAHQEIDLARPKENENVSGFLPEERAWMDKFFASGFIDTYRFLHPQKVSYSWWSYRTRARARNIGWRLDYFFVSQNLVSNIHKAQILTEVQGSDHCPVSLELQI